MRIVLDSTFVIDVLRGEPDAVRRLRRMFEEGDDAIVTDVVVCEVRTGLLAEAEQHLDAFLEPIEFVQPGAAAAKTAGRWRGELRATGRTLSLGDALIAACADGLGAAVLTRNVRDFALTPVPIETY